MKHCPEHAYVYEPVRSEKGNQRSLGKQPKMTDWIAARAAIDPLQTDFREHRLDSQKYQDTIEPGCHVGSRQKKETPRNENPLRLSKDMIRVDEMLDDFRHDYGVEDPVPKRKINAIDRRLNGGESFVARGFAR